MTSPSTSASASQASVLRAEESFRLVVHTQATRGEVFRAVLRQAYSPALFFVWIVLGAVLVVVCAQAMNAASLATPLSFFIMAIALGPLPLLMALMLADGNARRVATMDLELTEHGVALNDRRGRHAFRVFVPWKRFLVKHETATSFVFASLDRFILIPKRSVASEEDVRHIRAAASLPQR